MSVQVRSEAMKPHRLRELLSFYREVLLEDVIPFWMKHAIDPKGGINTCIGDDGTLLSRDRWNWSQWRAVWVFGHLYNQIEERSEWLEAAHGILRFITAHGPLADGHWPLLLDGDGAVQKGYESLYVDGFAIYALAEYYKASGDELALQLALDTFEASERAFALAEPPPAFPYPIPRGRMPHGMSMLFSLVYHELAQVSRVDRVRAAALCHHRKVMETFLRKDRGVVLEWLTQDGKEVPPPEGTAVVPGHAIESMWFQIHIARDLGDPATVQQAVKAIRRHLELGWDSEYGGLFLAVDAEGREEVGWRFADTKIWWPHTEALYATLLAFECCHEDWCLEWHQRIRDYSFSHFPDCKHGEWTQKLDRKGNRIGDLVGLPVKDPFHLPRALAYCMEVLERLIVQER
jgi:N-acylglucosamine 2-epimerase